VHVPLTHARPATPWFGRPPNPETLQSANVEQGPHRPAAHPCPASQSAVDWQAPQARNVAEHPSPDAQSEAVVHAQLPPWHVAPGPHCVFDVQGPQTPAVHTSPMLQPAFDAHAGVHTPDAHVSPPAQSLLAEHVHSTVVCVAVHWALGPHWSSAEHVPQAPPAQTWPAWHCAFDVQVPASPVAQPDAGHGAQARTGKQFPLMTLPSSTSDPAQ
jgi:hypothetical protein